MTRHSGPVGGNNFKKTKKMSTKKCGFCAERGYVNPKNLLKINFQHNFPSIYNNKKIKNEQKVNWLEEDYMEMKMIVVRNQSRIISTCLGLWRWIKSHNIKSL